MRKLKFLFLLTLVQFAAGHSFAELRSTPPDAFRVPEGFEVELVYEVPLESQGSWVAMATDRDGTLIVSDQYGGLYRVSFAEQSKDVSVKSIAAPVGKVQGICPTKDGLYVNVNGNDAAEGSGVYRLQDLDQDGTFESSKKLIAMSGTSEHGPHAIIEGKDGRLFAISGNDSEIPDQIDRSRVPRLWGNDHLLGRMPDARGFMANRMGPGGFVLSFNPDGSDIELIAVGFRNQYDIAFNKQGDLFTFDADMEWDVGTPWYRPTRVNHIVSGVDFGWRNGTGKYPAYAADSFGAVVDVGYGSPTGIVFPYETNFPEPYRSSLLIGDWSYGVIYAVDMQADGGSYTGSLLPFVSAAPMAVTDMVVRPQDQCLYVSVGGRKTQSALYRVRYTGPNKEAKPVVLSVPAEWELRQQLEAHHHPSAEPSAIRLAIQHLRNKDRSLRSAARIVLEHQELSKWKNDVLELRDPQSIITASVALARAGSKETLPTLVTYLSNVEWGTLDDVQKLEMLRAYQIMFTRMGKPDESQVSQVVQQLSKHFTDEKNAPLINRELAVVLLYLSAPGAVERSVELLRSSPSADDQIHYAISLREIETGWTEKTREAYFQWFFDITSARGGESFGGFISNIRKAAINKLPEAEKAELGELITKTPTTKDPAAELASRALVREWSVEEAFEAAQANRTASFENGKKMFAVAQCYQCHRFAGQGGIQGPDLTGAGGRFSPRDLITAIVDPNKEISDQYQATQFLLDDDMVVTGRVANMNGDTLSIATNMLDPERFTPIKRSQIVETKPSPVSMMPSGLLNTLTAEDVNDLVTYIRSMGRPDSSLYTK